MFETAVSRPSAWAGEVDEFPDWLAPMVVKELRQGLRARWFVVPFVAVQVAAVALVWLEYMATKHPGTPFGSEEFGHQAFWGLVFLVLGGVLPLRLLTGLSSELAGDGGQMILLAGLSRWRIVMGKWLTQMVLGCLVLVSLVPYGLVRYFFGGVELVPNLTALAAALGLAAAMNALVLGASGFADYWVRAVITIVGWMYVGAPAVTMPALMNDVADFDDVTKLATGLGLFLWTGLGVMLTFAFFTLCGLQLARARLRVAGRHWGVPPSRPVLVLFFLAPLYFGILSMITCGLGFPVVAAGMTWWIWSLDPADLPARSEMYFIHPKPTVTPKTYRF